MTLFNKTFALGLFILSASVQAEIAVIVHVENGASISEDDVKKIFMGKLAQFPDGKPTSPVTFNIDSSIRESFDTGFLSRQTHQIEAMWSKLVFTGKSSAPKVVDNSAAALEYVSSNPNAIAYIDAKDVTPNVKVLFKF